MPQLRYPKDHAQAELRAKQWEKQDPFSDIAPALITAPQIDNYVRVTGFIHPYNDEHLKGATYEIGISGHAYYWDESGHRRVVSVRDEGFRGITLRPNSITFVETDVVFRLPQYIAVRFNLHIKLVHRGLLLGTGPIVDPGFRGRLLIPLHNLTSSSYTIAEGEKIVWAEFTKTSYGQTSQEPEYKTRSPGFKSFPNRKKYLTAEQYLWKANANNPIMSSISGFISDVKQRVEKNEADVRGFERVGWAAIFITVALGLGTAIGIYSSALSLLQDYEDKRSGLENRIHQLECKVTPAPDC